MPSPIVAEQVRTVLMRNPAYQKVTELTTGALFVLSVKPNPLLLATDMVVALDENGPGTTVTVTISSQALIVGDAGGFYYRYARDFLIALEDSLRSIQGSQVVSAPAAYRMETNWASVALLLLLVLFGIWIVSSLHIPMFRLIAALAVIMVVSSLIRIVRGGRLFR